MASQKTTEVLRQPPIVGDGLELEKLRVAPLSFLMENTERFGDIFCYTASGWRGVVLNHPSYVRHVLHADSSLYSKVGTPDLMMLKPMLGVGLMTSEGESWSRQRRAAQPEFQRSRIDGYIRFMNDIVAAMLERWAQNAARGDPVDVENEMSRLTLEVVARCLFGADLGLEQGEFGSAVAVMNEYMGHFDPTDFQRLLRFQQSVLLLDRIVNRIVAERRTNLSAGPDLLSTLLAEQPVDEGGNRVLRDQIFTFLMAGHETTAKSLTWTLYLLDRHPEILECVDCEVRQVLAGHPPTGDDIEHLTYTWMTLQEAMRLYPPVWQMSRMCLRDDLIDGFQISAGTLVLISPYAIHRYSRYWAVPDVFDPQRFEPAQAAKRIPYTYLPFSAGPRACIGRVFATAEAIVVLASILQRFRLRLVPGYPVQPDALVTLRPKFGMPMTIEPVRPIGNMSCL